MTLPLSRDYNAVDGGPLPHTVVNNLQDAVVNKRHGAIFREVLACRATIIGGAPTITEGERFIMPPNTSLSFPIPVEIGDTILDYFLFSHAITTNTDLVNFAVKESGWAVGAGFAGAGILAPGPTASTTDGTLNVHVDGAALSVAKLVAAAKSYYLQVDAPVGNANNMGVLSAVFQIHRV